MAEHLANNGWGPATLSLNGLGKVRVGPADHNSIRVAGDPLRFVLAATGRLDPAELGLEEKVNIYG